jgi:glycosyltransferase involved in cell wall biosynthesis
MKILLLTQSFSTTIGGGETVFNIMGKSLAESGNSVSVITNKIKGEEYDSYTNIKFVFVPPTLKKKGGQPPTLTGNIIYVISTILKGILIVKKEKIDIIHSNNYAASLAGSMISLLTGKPNILVIHDILSLEKNFYKEWVKQQNISKLTRWLGPMYEKMMIKLKCVAFHTVSEASKDDLIKFGAKKPIYVIPNAIEINEFRKSEIIPYQFIYIGRLIFYKNLEVVIKAIKIIRDSYPKISLIIVGSGPHKEKIERLIHELNLQDNIKFKGHLSNEEKEAWLASSQALVFPSLLEGFGLVVLEAFEFGKPVLVSDLRPLSDIVSNQITGLVIPPHDENAWGIAMEQIIKDPERAKKMGLAGREVLEKKYNVQVMLEKILSMYADFT